MSLNLHFPFPSSLLKFRRDRCPSLSRNVSSFSSSNNTAAAAIGRPGEPAVLPEGLQRELLPRHVAIIMDGHRRWALMKGLPVQSGYPAGVRTFMRVVHLCCSWGIKVLTLFAFSTDNWVRPKVETDFLMALFRSVLKNELHQLMSEGVRISIIGDSSKCPASTQELIANVEETSVNNPRLHLIIAVNYSGQNDIVQACQKLAVKAKDGIINPEDINKVSVERELETNCTKIPSPDLLIRTSGELRISNFLLWQLAFTELYFERSLWPDFSEADFQEALFSFQKRQRRFGGSNS